MEAWEWLVREGPFARKPSSPGWYFITRRGERIKTRSDLEVYRLGDQTKIKNNRHEDTETLRRAPDETLLKGRYKIVRPITTTGFSQTISRRGCPIALESEVHHQTVRVRIERFTKCSNDA